jgi:hypothetical protein
MLPGEQQFRQGDFARHVEAYMLADDYTAAQDYLDQWAEQFPAARLEGYWSLLQTQLYMLAEHYADAAMEAEVLVGVNAGSNYGGQLLMLAANAYHRMGMDDEVERTLRAIVDDYSESPYAGEAAEALENR